METMQWLIITKKKTKKRRVGIPSRDFERFCQSIVKHLVNSIIRMSYREHHMFNVNNTSLLNIIR